MEIIVYLTEDYSVNESIWVDADLSRLEITSIINEKFSVWYYYDIN
jgi:hypothetical protein